MKGITVPKGFTAAAINADIKGAGKDKEDLMVIYCDGDAVAAGAFTTNRMRSGTVERCVESIGNPTHRGVVALSGIANTCTADDREKAVFLQKEAAEFLKVKPEEVLLATTGKIGSVLRKEPIENGFAHMPEPTKEGGDQAARAIMTSDTYPKTGCYEMVLSGKKASLGFMGKGSGMIHPNMATTLSFFTTDAAISKELLQKALSIAIDSTLNMLSVDGDTSTNDTCLILASGQAENPLIDSENEDFTVFLNTLTTGLRDLAKMIARDGEGSSKMLIGRIIGAKNTEDARKLAKAIITSTRFKAAMSGSDNYWGRNISNMGNTGVAFDLMTLSVRYEWPGGEWICYDKGKENPFPEDLLQQMGAAEELIVEVNLNAGDGKAEAYGCNLTKKYIDSVVSYS